MKKFLQKIIHNKYLNKPIYLLFGVFLFCGIIARAQSSPGEFNGQIHTDANDYYLRVYWGTDLPWINDDDTHGSLSITGPGWNSYNHTVHYNDGYRNYPAGSSTTYYGPNRSYGLNISYDWGKDCTGCTLKWGTNTRGGTTPKLKAPISVNLQTTVIGGITYPSKLTWDKGTSVLDNLVDYYIYLKKGNANPELMATVAGDKREYVIDNSNMESGDYVYSVQTVLNNNAPSDWNRNKDIDCEPAVNTPSINILNNVISATTAENNKIKLSWLSYNNVLGLDAIVIFRKIASTNQVEEIATISKASKTYSDLDIVPGQTHHIFIDLSIKRLLNS